MLIPQLHMLKNLLPSTLMVQSVVTRTSSRISSLVSGVPLSPTQAKTPMTRPDEHSRRLALAQMDTLRKIADNHPMQPSGEIGRFEVEDQPSPPADRNR